MAILEVKDLKTYFYTRMGTIKAVDNVSFELEKGETLGLAGESGCGKTTTCLSIMRMIQSPGKTIDGEILFKSEDLLKMKKKALQKIRGKNIAMIFQGAMNALNPVHRVGNQIHEVIKIHDPHVSEEEGWKRVLDTLSKVGIDSSRARDYPHQLSGGMQQRALIALALVSNPEIIMADEPVTALDVIVQAQVLKAMKTLQKQLGLSLIMITHDLSVIAEICDSLAIMYAGQIVEYGKLRNLFKEPRHPYTEALLNAFPSITGVKTELMDIPGAPPDLLNPPTGCNFHPRCPKVMARCQKEDPKIVTTNGKGYVTCHLY
ncbi:MAG: ABC transporter ATP-binding protein [Candidatus Hodarchaeales archaeon]|jgi:peptide/nickel transport system ATP-binding protein